MMRRLLILTAFLLGARSVLHAQASAPAQPQSQPATGTTVVAVDMYYLRDANRTPMRRLPPGTIVRVVAREGAWFKVVFTDPRFGDETGYVMASTVRVDGGSLAETGRGHVLSQRGFIEVRGYGFPEQAANDSKRLVGDALWREEVQLTPARWLQLSAGLDVRANSDRQVDDAWRIDVKDRGIQRPRAAVRRLAATVTTGHFTLDIGKQFVRWGKADILNPTDRFAPRDYLNVLDSQFLPIWAASASLQLGAENFEAVYQPQVTPSRLPLFDQRWSVLPAAIAGLPIVDRGADFPDRAQQGARWNHVGSTFEMSLSVFDGVNHLPDVAGGVTATGAVEVIRSFPRLRTYGGDLAVPTRLFTLKGEAALFKSSTTTSDEYALYVIELERQVGEWLFDGGYAGEVVTRDRGQVSFAAERGVARSFVGHASYTMGPRRGLVLEGVVRQTGDGGYFKGEYSQGFGQHWRLTLAGVAVGGDPDDFLGRYRKNSSGSASFRLSF